MMGKAKKNIRTVRFMARQGSDDLYFCKENNRVYIRRECGNNYVQWFKTSKWSGGYEADYPVKAGFIFKVVDGSGNPLFEEAIHNDEQSAITGNTYATKGGMFSHEALKTLEQQIAEWYHLRSYDEWRDWLMEDKPENTDKDHWLYNSVEYGERAPIAKMSYLGRPVHAIVTKAKHKINGKSWICYDIIDNDDCVLALCGYQFENQTTTQENQNKGEITMDNHNAMKHPNEGSNNNQNFVYLDNQKIELTDEQAAKVRDCLEIGRIKLSEVPVGETFRIGEYEFIVLERFIEHFEGTTAVVLKDCYGGNQDFGKNNNYAGSDAEEVCAEFAAKIADIVGADNLIKHKVDLTALDGRHDYGKVWGYMSPLTLDRYRRYVDILDEHRLNRPWWLATPLSTAPHGIMNSRYVCYVSDNTIGTANSSSLFVFRPFCILKSSTTVCK